MLSFSTAAWYDDGRVPNQSQGSADASAWGSDRELRRVTLMGDRDRGLVLCCECTLRRGGTALGRPRSTEITHRETLSPREAGSTVQGRVG